MQATRARLVRHETAESAWEPALRAPAPALREHVRGDYVGYSEAGPGLLRRRDQAHLVRDVRQFTGLTPTAARASLTPWPNEAS